MVCHVIFSIKRYNTCSSHDFKFANISRCCRAERFSPKSYKFSYPMSFFGFDLAELKQINAQASIFGYNEAKPLRLNDSDYLNGSSEPIIEQLDRLLPVKKLGHNTS